MAPGNSGHASTLRNHRSGRKANPPQWPSLETVAHGARIQDKGCELGRDSNSFLDGGYDVVRCDTSERMVEMAGRRTGKKCLHMRFDELEFAREFDGYGHPPHSSSGVCESHAAVNIRREFEKRKPSWLSR
jgi:SAM-dependent methyltransferase